MMISQESRKHRKTKAFFINWYIDRAEVSNGFNRLLGSFKEGV